MLDVNESEPIASANTASNHLTDQPEIKPLFSGQGDHFSDGSKGGRHKELVTMFDRLPQSGFCTDIGNFPLHFEDRPAFFQKVFQRWPQSASRFLLPPGPVLRSQEQSTKPTPFLAHSSASHSRFPLSIVDMQMTFVSFVASFKDAIRTGHHIDHLLVV